MVSLAPRRPLAATTTIAVALVLLLAPFSAPAQTADAPPINVCARPVPADGASSPLAMDREVDKALSRAIRKVNAERYADARVRVGELEFDQLTPYELAMAEGVLFRIADAEQKYDEARDHLVRAIESCGLTEQGIADAQDAIERINGRLAMYAACGGGPLCESTLAAKPASTSRPPARQPPYTRSPWPTLSPPIVNGQACKGCGRAIDGGRGF